VLTLDQLYALVDLMPDRWTVFVLLKTFASLRWGEITALTGMILIWKDAPSAFAESSSPCQAAFS
jgi:hypothetical protein